MSFDISAAAGGSVQFRFQLTSDISIRYSGYFIDEVRVATDCVRQSGGLVVGNVHDGNTGAPLVGAQIVTDGGGTAISARTPDDWGVDDGFYTLFSPAGSHPITATMMGGYSPGVRNLTVRLGNTIRQDFSLRAGWINSDLVKLAVALMMSTNATIPLSLTNNGGVTATFELRERAGGFEPAIPSAPGRILLMGGDVDAAGWNTYREALAAAGRTWDEWNLDVLTFPAAADLAPYDDLIWFDESILTPGDPECQIVADWLASGDKGFFATSIDFLWDLQDGTPGQGEHNLYLLLNTQYLGNYAGSAITALEGVAGDPIGGDFPPPNAIALAGSNDNNGDYADETSGAPTGLLYGSGSFGTGHSSLTHYDGPNYRTVWLGVNFHNGLSSQSDRDQLMANILDFLNAGRDVPWLSVNPITGTLDTGMGQRVDVVFDAGVPDASETGIYSATLVVSNDTSYSPLTIPVTMTVLAPGFGAGLSPDQAKTGVPGDTVTYTLQIANTGSFSDSFDLTITGHTWATTLSDSSVSLAAGKKRSLTVMVEISNTATVGDGEMVTVTATSQGDRTHSAAVTLTTTVAGFRVFLPLIFK